MRCERAVSSKCKFPTRWKGPRCAQKLTPAAPTGPVLAEVLCSPCSPPGGSCAQALPHKLELAGIGFPAKQLLRLSSGGEGRGGERKGLTHAEAEEG